MPKVKRKTKAKSKGGIFSRFRDYISQYMTAAAAGVTVVAIGLAALFWAGGYFGLLGEQVSRMTNAGAVAMGMDVRRVTAKGLDNTQRNDILDAVGPVIGSSIFHFDPHAARARVENLGWVRVAAVSRLWPNSVHVSIRERRPAAVWQMSGTLHLIDENGVVIAEEISDAEYTNLPLIVGAGAPATANEILRALRKEPALWGAATALVRVGDRRWNMRLQKGGDVKFPETDISNAVRDLARLHDAYGILDRELEYVDLRDPENLIYREAGADEAIAG